MLTTYYTHKRDSDCIGTQGHRNLYIDEVTFSFCPWHLLKICKISVRGILKVCKWVHTVAPARINCPSCWWPLPGSNIFQRLTKSSKISPFIYSLNSAGHSKHFDFFPSINYQGSHCINYSLLCVNFYAHVYIKAFIRTRKLLLIGRWKIRKSVKKHNITNKTLNCCNMKYLSYSNFQKFEIRLVVNMLLFMK